MAEETRHAAQSPLDTPPRPPARGGGIGSLVVGGVLVAVGVPMLVLPGPGIAAIVGGGLLIRRGVRGRKGP